MNARPIVPADVVFDADGTARSIRDGDVYHPRGGALGQARHVFLAGNGLPERWRGREHFVVLETGFGLGTNFLAAWQAWRADAARSRRLHVVSIDLAPPRLETLVAVPRDVELAALADALAARWPPLVSGLHRLAFDAGAVELLLAFGDVATWLPQLTAAVDAFFLDGFAPAVNPAMWDARVFESIARLAAPGATAATWSAASAVRRRLGEVGFAVDAAPGFAGKREMTRARFAPRFQPRPSPRRTASTLAAEARAAADGETMDVAVVGAGLAGCAIAAALAENGVGTIVVVDRADAVASGASGNAAGIFHGVVHGADGRHARLYRSAALAAAAEARRAIADGVAGAVDGVVRVEPRVRDVGELQGVLDRLGWPAEYVRAVDGDEASRLAGLPLRSPAWFFPEGGWIEPRALCRHWLRRAGAGVRLRLDADVAALERDGRSWRLLDAQHRPLARAATVVLANGGGALGLLGGPRWPLHARRGQVGAFAAPDRASGAAPVRPVTGLGYVLPPLDGRVWFGASSTRGDDNGLSATDRTFNLERLRELTGIARSVEAVVAERAAVRWIADDRMPIVGAVPLAAVGASAPFAKSELGGVCRSGDAHAERTRRDQPRFAPRVAGLFVCTALGSRGIALASLAARIVAASIADSPMPAEADLLDAIDPARFGCRDFRRGRGDETSGSARAVDETDRQPPVGPMAGSVGG